MEFEWARTSILANGTGSTGIIGIMTAGTRRKNGRGCEVTYKVTRGSILPNGTNATITIGLMTIGIRRKNGRSTGSTIATIMTTTRTLIKGSKGRQAPGILPGAIVPEPGGPSGQA